MENTCKNDRKILLSENTNKDIETIERINCKFQSFKTQ